jgi:AcrR family transcriptional regulator
VAKPLISAETIYDEALRVLEAEGVKGLTARNLASRLRCSTKTLYQFHTQALIAVARRGISVRWTLTARAA